MRLPEKFDLLDRARLDLLRNHITVGKARVYDQVKDMVIQPGVTRIACDQASASCMAVVEVLPTLLAIWTVSGHPNTGEVPEQMASRKAPQSFNSSAETRRRRCGSRG
jgi:hypothetical protein